MNVLHIAMHGKTLLLFPKAKDNDLAEFCYLPDMSVGQKVDNLAHFDIVVTSLEKRKHYSVVALVAMRGMFFHPNGNQRRVLARYQNQGDTRFSLTGDDQSYLTWPDVHGPTSYQGAQYSWKIFANPGLHEVGV